MRLVALHNQASLNNNFVCLKMLSITILLVHAWGKKQSFWTYFFILHSSYKFHS